MSRGYETLGFRVKSGTGVRFWAIVMAFVSMLPLVGAFVVWISASIFLLVSGHWLRALVLAAGGIGLIHPVDNIPLLVGPRLGLHPLVLLVAFRPTWTYPWAADRHNRRGLDGGLA